MDKLKSLEKQIFTAEVVDELPFKFFDLIANIIQDPKAINHIDDVKLESTLNSVNNIITDKKYELCKLYAKVTIDEGILKEKEVFINTYLKVFTFKYIKNFARFVHYSIRRIETVREYNLLKNLEGYKLNEDLYLSFDIDDLVPKTRLGLARVDEMKDREEKTQNIAAFFSTMSSYPYVSQVYWDSLLEITCRENVFDNKKHKYYLQELIFEISFSLIYDSSSKVYSSLTEDTNIKDSIRSLSDYYALVLDPDEYEYPIEFDGLFKNITKSTIDILNKLTILSNQTKQDLVYEILQVAMTLTQSGITIPNNYYQVNIRNAKEMDKINYRAKKCMDVYLLNKAGQKVKNTYESYALIVTATNMDYILEKTFENKYFYNRFKKLDVNG